MKTALRSPKVLAWKRLLEKNGAVFSRAPHPLASVAKGRTEETLFAFLEFGAAARDGTPLPGTVLVRGHAAVILPVLIEKETGARWIVLVRQPRAATGTWMTELPAGMLDSDVNRPRKAALREFEEEVGLPLGNTRLRPINREPLFTSPGLLDEGIFYFYFEKTLPRRRIRELNGLKRGCAEENETITVETLPLRQAFRQIRSLPALYALCWYALKKGEPLWGKRP
jgi:ADP-sugar diphosphatase